MKKRLLFFGVVAFLGRIGLGAQSITIQPYLSLNWDPVYYDSATGDTKENYRAFNLGQSGLKVTGLLGKVSAYAEVRGFPSSSTNYNEYDGSSLSHVSSWNKPIYYAWGKYQFTETGNIWGGKFKPNFGPLLFDSSHFGLGWQQQLPGGHTLSGFVLQPSVSISAYNPVTWISLAESGGIPSDEGIRFLVLEEYVSQTFIAAGGASYDYLGNDYNKLHFNVFTAFMGIPRLTLSAEGALAVYIKEGGVIKDQDKPTEADDVGLGLGVYVAAEYKVLDPLSLGCFFKLVDPLVGAGQHRPGDGKDLTTVVDGEISAAVVGLSVKWAPVKGFSIKPQMNVKFSNALNGVTPSNGTEDGTRVGIDFQLCFRWEPSIKLGPLPAVEL
ncbi:MAG: hypothetical protein LBD74_02125 [Spirochaetaceae bacterium]|nr:hypothetical protein [Spirochaetaceae bacterium]